MKKWIFAVMFTVGLSTVAFSQCRNIVPTPQSEIELPSIGQCIKVEAQA